MLLRQPLTLRSHTPRRRAENRSRAWRILPRSRSLGSKEDQGGEVRWGGEETGFASVTTIYLPLERNDTTSSQMKTGCTVLVWGCGEEGHPGVQYYLYIITHPFSPFFKKYKGTPQGSTICIHRFPAFNSSFHRFIHLFKVCTNFWEKTPPYTTESHGCVSVRARHEPPSGVYTTTAGVPRRDRSHARRTCRRRACRGGGMAGADV